MDLKGPILPVWERLWCPLWHHKGMSFGFVCFFCCFCFCVAQFIDTLLSAAAPSIRRWERRPMETEPNPVLTWELELTDGLIKEGDHQDQVCRWYISDSGPSCSSRHCWKSLLILKIHWFVYFTYIIQLKYRITIVLLQVQFSVMATRTLHIFSHSHKKFTPYQLQLSSPVKLCCSVLFVLFFLLNCLLKLKITPGLPQWCPVQLDVSAQPTIAAVCPIVPACSALAPAVLLTLLGWRIRTAGPATMAGGTPPGAGLTPCCGGWVRDCWLFSKDSRRAGRLFCWRAKRRESERERRRESGKRF